MKAAYASVASDALTGHGFGVSAGGTHRDRAITLALAAAGGEVLISGRRKEPLL